MEKYLDYTLEQMTNLLSIDSPSGFTEEVTDYLIKEYERLGYSPEKTKKGGVLVHLGGYGNGVMLLAHVDTLGSITSEIKPNGRLKVSPIGGFTAANIETENCRIYTYDGRIYDGCFQLENASAHVNSSLNTLERNFDSIEVVIDEPVKTKEDVQKLGITNGCFVCANPRTLITRSGYIKSRFLDDKLSAAILLGYARYLKEENICLTNSIYQHMTVFEEVGHGGCASIPDDVDEIISVDMGCVGNGLECTEEQVSICVKDSRGPYHYDVVRGLIHAAQKSGVDFSADVYPFYGSDADAALCAGADVRHGLIGPGVYASHGYERSHKNGVLNTLKLLKEYLN